MAEKMAVYKCELCGNLVYVLDSGDGNLVCCGQPMKKLDEKTADQGKEKHVPVWEKNGNKVLVKVGDVQHPMEEKHFIQWIEVQTDSGEIFQKFLLPGEKPEASFEVIGNVVHVREICNIHGLWKS